MMFWYHSSKQYWDKTLLDINIFMSSNVLCQSLAMILYAICQRIIARLWHTQKHMYNYIISLSSDIDECSRCFNNSGTRFFPFGSQTEDILSNLSDDGSTLILLSSEFIFHGTTYTSVYVSFKSNTFFSLLRLIYD